MKILSLLKGVDHFFSAYTDIIGSFLIIVGGILATVSIGPLPGGDTLAGHGAVYLKHPFFLKEGLVAIVVGFVGDIVEKLNDVHHVDIRRIFWPIALLSGSLLVLVLGS